MRVVHYFRVSTAEQGRSGLGLEAQEAAVASFCKTRGCEVLGTYTEIESGKKADRPELLKALHHAKITNATLVVAKLDRLSRNVAFISALQDSKAKFVACDMPEANEITIGIMAVIAQAEAKAISTRTKEALRAAKARGVKLGNPNGAAALRRAPAAHLLGVQASKKAADQFANDLAPVINDIIANSNATLQAIADGLNARSMQTARGGRWHPTSVKNLLERLSK
jgi:DNA invertase Pin-like site-specific DNA recombinase